jgi:ATP/maltotriose-dependent transcriptional regulator MalT
MRDLLAACQVWALLTTCVHGRVMARRLTENECRIVRLIRDGLDTQEIAEELDVSRHTIRTRLRDIAFALTGDERGARMLELPDLAEERGGCG